MLRLGGSRVVGARKLGLGCARKHVHLALLAVDTVDGQNPALP